MVCSELRRIITGDHLAQSQPLVLYLKRLPACARLRLDSSISSRSKSKFLDNESVGFISASLRRCEFETVFVGIPFGLVLMLLLPLTHAKVSVRKSRSRSALRLSNFAGGDAKFTFLAEEDSLESGRFVVLFVCNSAAFESPSLGLFRSRNEHRART